MNNIRIITILNCPKCSLERIDRGSATDYFKDIKSGNKSNPKYVKNSNWCDSCLYKIKVKTDRQEENNLIDSVAKGLL